MIGRTTRGTTKKGGACPCVRGCPSNFEEISGVSGAALAYTRVGA